MSNIAILASGTGSNALQIIKHFKESKVADVKLVLTNKESAGVLEHAATFNIESKVIPNKVWIEEPEQVLQVLKDAEIDFIVLAGFLRKIPDNLVKAYPNGIVNIHPALLPKYGGKGMYGMNVHKAVFSNSERESGITIHWVNENYDEGQIIFQASVELENSDNPETIQKKVQNLEHEHFAHVIESLITKQQ